MNKLTDTKFQGITIFITIWKFFKRAAMSKGCVLFLLWISTYQIEFQNGMLEMT